MTAIPLRTGTLTATNSASAAAVIDITSVPNGSWMIGVLVSLTGIASAPEGWTSLLPSQAIGTRAFAVIGKTKESGDSSVSWNGTVGSFKRFVVAYGSGAKPVTDWLKGLAGVRNAANVVSGQSQQAGTSTTTVAPSVTTLEDNCLVIDVIAEATTNVGTTPTVSAGHTYWTRHGDADTSYLEQVVLAYKEMATAGATGASTTTFNQTQANNSGAIQIVLPPSPDPEPDPEGIPAEIGGISGKLFYFNGTSEVPVIGADYLEPEVHKMTVSKMDQMIADDELVYWSHRGGSVNWGQMTMRAYTNSVWWGCPILEVTCRQSSDGVWIMIHDTTTDAVTATSYTVASTPSSTLLGIPVDTPATGGVLGRLEDLLEAYPDLLILADRKAAGNLTNFLDILETVPDAQEHIILKWDGTYDRPAATAARARGFKTASYFWEASYTESNLDLAAPLTDYLGLDYAASQSTWDVFLAKGLPMWGHICPDAASASAAVSKGASILQCSGVTQIVPTRRHTIG